MQTRFVLGPAGSGKTFRCLTEIRKVLAVEPDGPPLLLIAPKQTTYQLERQLLAYPSVAGYTRLQILSFERLAFFLFNQLQKPPPRMLDEEGRLMVLRGLLARKRDELKLFRASARLTGFAQHLSKVLRELQRYQLTPESLAELAEKAHGVEGLSLKLQDLATLLRDYLDWLAAHELQDADNLLNFATNALREPHSPLQLGEMWVDGFTELSPQELDLLAEVLPQVPQATFTFCLDEVPKAKVSWLSNWSVPRRTYFQCRERLAGLPHVEIKTELLERHMNKSRFLNNPALHHLERHWAEPKKFVDEASAARPHSLSDAVRVITCPNPEAEATLAAREILQFVRGGGRFREVNVLVRKLDGYHEALASTFKHYDIPYFLDRRESVAHHPLAELTRNALRTVAYSWTSDDWFAALKTGLVPAEDTDIDRLENEALARGWRGSTWQKPIAVPDKPEMAEWLETLRLKIVPPFQKFALRMAMQKSRPNGVQLAAALREFWHTLKVEETLQKWSVAEISGSESQLSPPIHLTVWEQMGAWLDNVELAFPTETLPLREWLPILEAGLASLTVGVIPPALDQVLIGAIDRSRNPDIRLALVLGMNEGVFPAPPEQTVLLTDADRAELEKQDIHLGASTRQQLGHERYYGYVACTRARERVVLTSAIFDASGKPLNPSPFLSPLKQLFPALEFENFPKKLDWRESEHANELIIPLLRNQIQGPTSKSKGLSSLNKFPALAVLQERLKHFNSTPAEESLSPKIAEQLYGPALRTSVSRMEQFAACPFKFFVHSGLRAEERKLFELDIRDQGNFQHEVLAYFHDQLRAEGKRWRDITAAEARERIKNIATTMMVSFRDGLLQVSEETKFTARILTESLQDFVETLIGWMREQYAFDPTAVELPFGQEVFPAWELDLGKGHRLMLHGRIDRIDICREGDADEALCVVVDYKSSHKQLDPLLMEHGLQLQLAAYLNVLRHWPDPRLHFGVQRLIPAGVFYVNLRGKYKREANRDDVLTDVDTARKLAYRHSGRFDAGVLSKLDQRTGVTRGDQFNYRLKKDGTIYANSSEALQSFEFEALLDGVETSLKKMGEAIYAGVAKLDPYRKGTATACEGCDYHSICRIDPWLHQYRLLHKSETEQSAPSV
ncbi:MAG: helicase-exonuclease AddAB subunit AddB [Pedosphaera sp.]|nr:helicase-exonuclease AddAB subunit AddB [Pedosphaera sp.]